MQSAQIDGPRLRRLREDRELTGDVLADLVSARLGRRVDPSTIYKIEKGSRQPSARLFGAICRVLQCEKSELITEATDEPADAPSPDVAVPVRVMERAVPVALPELRGELHG